MVAITTLLRLSTIQAGAPDSERMLLHRPSDGDLCSPLLLLVSPIFTSQLECPTNSAKMIWSEIKGMRWILWTLVGLKQIGWLSIFLWMVFAECLLIWLVGAQVSYGSGRS